MDVNEYVSECLRRSRMALSHQMSLVSRIWDPKIRAEPRGEILGLFDYGRISVGKAQAAGVKKDNHRSASATYGCFSVERGNGNMRYSPVYPFAPVGGPTEGQAFVR